VQLLLACAHAHLAPPAKANLQHLLSLPLDWEQVLSLASMHGLLPLLHSHLREYSQEPSADGAPMPSSLVPPEVARHLQSEFNVAVAGNLFLTAELINILRHLAAQDIPVLCYKGPSLAVLSYGNLLLRPFNDLDLLLQRPDLQRAEAVLTAMGYKLGQHSDVETNEYAHCLSREVGPDATEAVVELHWSIAPRHEALPLPMEAIWKRTAQVDLCGTKAPVPAREELILLLCCHGYKHRWERIEWISGIASLLAGETPVDWRRLMSLARRWGVRRVLFLGLWLAHQLLGARLEKSALRAVRRDTTVTTIADAIMDSLLQPPPLSDDVTPPMAQISLYHLKMRERLRDKLRYGLALALTPHQISRPDLNRLIPKLFASRSK
jgi:hypothetical protein